MRECIIILSLLTYHYAFLQNFSTQWDKSYVSGNGKSKIKDAVYTNYLKRTAIYVTGEFENTLVIGKDTLISKGGKDIFVAKFDTLFNPKWAFSIGSPQDDYSVSIVQQNSIALNFYLVFNFQENCTVKTYTLNSAGSFDIGIARLDTLGNILSVKRFGGTDEDWANDANSTYNLHCTGYFKGHTQLDTFNLHSAGGKDIFVFRLDFSVMNVNLAKRHGGTGDDEGLVIQNTEHFGGYFTQTATIDTFTLTSAGGKDGFIYYNYSAPKKVFHIKGAGDEAFTALHTKGFAGYFENNAEFIGYNQTFTLNSKGGKDVFFGKYTDYLPIQVEQIFSLGSKGNDISPRLHTINNIDYVYFSFIASDTVEIASKIIPVHKPNAILCDIFIRQQQELTVSEIRQVYSAAYSDIVAAYKYSDSVMHVTGNFTDQVMLNTSYIVPYNNSFMARSRTVKNIVENLMYLDINNYRFPVWGDGTLFWDKTGTSFIRIPKDSASSPIFMSSLMVAGLNGASEIRSAGYELYSKSYTQGPVTAPEFYYAYMPNALRVWKFNRTEIERHKKLYNIKGYVIPDNIKTYPGNGNTALGQAAQLLPYFDNNNNGIYEPEKGDYPLIKGDQAIWAIYSDDLRTRGYYPAMKIEVHQQVYGYNCPQDSILHNTFFIERTIYNRSSETYSQVLAGDYCDNDLGSYTDDANGCDSTLHIGYTYNADSYDENKPGYKNYPPAIGIVVLDREMYAYKHYVKNWGPCNDQPMSYEGVYHVLQGRYMTGEPVYNDGDDGCLSTPGSMHTPYLTRYFFSGDPETNTGWNYPYSSGDVKFIISAQPYSVLEPGQSITYNTAYIFSQSKEPNQNKKSVTLLKKHAVYIRNGYQNNLFQPCTSFDTVITYIEQPLQANVYPNPTQDILNIDLETSLLEDGVEITLSDILGKRLFTFRTTQPRNRISLEALSRGLYIIQIRDKKKILHYKIVKP